MQHYTCACLQKGQPIKQRRLNHGEGEEELHFRVYLARAYATLVVLVIIQAFKALKKLLTSKLLDG